MILFIKIDTKHAACLKKKLGQRQENSGKVVEWTDATWKNVLPDESTFQIVFRNHGCRVLRAKEEKELPGCCRLQKPASVMLKVMLVPMASWVTVTFVKTPLMLYKSARTSFPPCTAFLIPVQKQ